MILRPRQQEAKEKALAAMKEREGTQSELGANTLVVAPTGAGKTAIISGTAGEYDSILILQHREELVSQNMETFQRINPGKHTDVCIAERKRFLSIGATFGMIQTLARPNNMRLMKPVGIVAIDESHHAPSESYQIVLRRIRELYNRVHIFGVTATPSRSDQKALATTFDNVADVITLSELIQGGFLVRPRTFVIDCGMADELRSVRKTAADFDMSEVEKIMDKTAVNSRVFDEWNNLAGNRSTVIFCSTVAHAQHVYTHFTERGVTAEFIHGKLSKKERAAAFDRFDKGLSQVLVNVAVATEGWDCQHVSCVILLRPCSHKSTVLQMIGRGLRKVDPERYPWAQKDDCIVIDFGYSLITHGSLDIEIELDPERRKKKRIPCPACGAEIPPTVIECPICGAVINERRPRGPGGGAREDLDDFKLTEIELIESSPYRWEEIFESLVLIANGLTAWACCVCYDDRWYALGGKDDIGIKMLANSGERYLAITAADDFLREHGDKTNARKSRSWLSLPATEAQLSQLQLPAMAAISTSRYRASALLTWKFNEKYIRGKILT